MKTCPTCRSTYTDDTLRFCLQDGARLESYDAGEPTLVLGRDVTEDVNLPYQTDRSRTTAVATRKGPKTSTIVAVTAVGMLVLFGLIMGIRSIYLKNPRVDDAQIASRANVTNREQQDGAVAEVPRSSATVSPSRSPVPQTLSTEKAEEVKSEVMEAVYDWARLTEDRDFDGMMSNYAGKVDYYLKSGASKRTVADDKVRAFSKYESISLEVSNVAVTPGPDGRTAKAEFDKKWKFDGNGTSEGKVRSLIEMAKTDGRWLITAEKDIRVYAKNDQTQ